MQAKQTMPLVGSLNKLRHPNMFWQFPDNVIDWVTEVHVHLLLTVVVRPGPHRLQKVGELHYKHPGIYFEQG